MLSASVYRAISSPALPISCRWLLPVFLACCCGCSLLPNRQIAACKHEKQQLLARIEQDQHRLLSAEARAREATEREREATERLAEAEKHLALVHDGRPHDAPLGEGRLGDERLAVRPLQPQASTSRSATPASTTPGADGVLPAGASAIPQPLSNNGDWTPRATP
jgi:hypothetical protein